MMTSNKARILAVDYGQVRIGLALSDPLEISAQPLMMLERKTDLLAVQQIRELIEEHDVACIVIGLPRNMDGSLGPQAQRVQDFADLAQHEIPNIQIVMWDERLTTVQSERMLIEAGVSRKKRKKSIDKLAACLLLQNYLDYRKNVPPESPS